MISLRPSIAVAASLLFCAPLAAQVGDWNQIRFSRGETPDVNYAFAVAGGEDVDGDGVDDIIVGSWNEDHRFRPRAGAAYVYSGATGAEIHRIGGRDRFDHFGYAVALIPDINADGFADIVVGAIDRDSLGLEHSGAVIVISGADKTELWSFDGGSRFAQLGWSVASAGDIDGDGVGDIICGSPTAYNGVRFGRSGRASVLSGATGHLLRQWRGAPGSDRFGLSVAGVGDIDGDGLDDVIVGDPFAQMIGPYTGQAKVFSGGTGELIFAVPGTSLTSRLGMSVGGLGDVNGDSIPDFIIGSPGFGNAGVFSGADGTGLYAVAGDSSAEEFGFSVAGIGDVTRDGIPDFLVGAPMASPGGRAGAGAMYLYSGESGSLVQKLEGTQPGDELGHSVARCGDTNGDAIPDFLGGARFSGTSAIDNLGAYLLADFDGYLTLSQNTLSVQTGGVSVLQIDFPQSEAGLPYGVLMSSTGGGTGYLHGVALNLTQDQTFQKLLNGFVPPMLSHSFGQLGPRGNATVDFTLAAGASSRLIGVKRWMAVVSLTPGSLQVRKSTATMLLEIVP